uniref:C-type lectin domain-containing protein n=1 Tax=Acrobeloides nanus TaxID=290746 RepID=A0A914BUB0_9BILA
MGPKNLCYETFTEATTWYQAEEKCYKSGGHLASASDSFTNTFLSGLADGSFNGKNYWLGGTTNYLGGTWTWSDYSNFTYTYWANDPTYNIGYCLAQLTPSAQWVNSSCALLKPFICEFSSNNKTNFCPNDWLYSQALNKCLYFYKTSDLNWADAIQLCKSFNSTLITIHSYAENTLMAGYNQLMFPEDNDISWIGLYDPYNNGNYIWVDGSPVNFTYWYKSPQNGLCGVFAPWSVILFNDLDEGKWGVFGCGSTAKVTCQLSL